MESSDTRSSIISSYPSRKRKPSPESNSSLDRHEIRAETVDQGFEPFSVDSSPILRQLECKDQELEARVNSMCMELKTMQSVNQDLKSQIQNLQHQCDRLLSHDRELELRTNRCEQRSHRTETMNENFSTQMVHLQQHSRKVIPTNLDVDQLVKDFEERCDLVESNNQGLTERLDSCQQNVLKMRQKNEDFESELTSLQQRFNTLGIHRTNIAHNGTVPSEQLLDENIVKSEPIEDVNTAQGTVAFPNNNTNNRLLRYFAI